MLASKDAKVVGAVVGLVVFAIPLGLMAQYIWANTPTEEMFVGSSIERSNSKNKSPLLLGLRIIEKNHAILTFKNISEETISIFLPISPVGSITLSLNGKDILEKSTFSENADNVSHELTGAVVPLRAGDSYVYRFDISKYPRGKILGAKYDTKEILKHLQLWRGSVKSSRVAIP